MKIRGKNLDVFFLILEVVVLKLDLGRSRELLRD